ncbi:hypothetical protein EYF80_052919 [Liparis tanakae]|uniref:Uncharacterized protein n=1 Tax=Liparis tanakae TaxID=230148 RepID=A0A4Z2F7Y6_9TELE|nr:hypothetical protein EYF80_052919 [Liparis tanakae]
MKREALGAHDPSWSIGGGKKDAERENTNDQRKRRGRVKLEGLWCGKTRGWEAGPIEVRIPTRRFTGARPRVFVLEAPLRPQAGFVSFRHNAAEHTAEIHSGAFQNPVHAL